MILSINPNIPMSAWVMYNHRKPIRKRIHDCGIDDNAKVVSNISDIFAMDGVPRLSSVIRLVVILAHAKDDSADMRYCDMWTGRLVQAFSPVEHIILSIDAVRESLFSANPSWAVNDQNVRQLLINKYGPPGRAVKQGPTYNVKGPMWLALAAADYACVKALVPPRTKT